MPVGSGSAWYGPPTRQNLGVFRADDGKTYQITRGRNAWHTTISYWWMQISGQSLSMSAADYEAAKFDFHQLPRHQRPDALTDLNMQAWYHATGWPMPALACSVHWKQQILNSNITYTVRGGIQLPRDAAFNPRALPLTPVWPGFVVDTLIFAGAWLALGLGLGAWRRRRRERRGLCRHCAYPTADLPEGSPCPECGRAASSRTTTARDAS